MGSGGDFGFPERRSSSVKLGSPIALCERIKITGQQKLFAALGGDGWPLSSANNSHKSSFQLRFSALNLILVVDTLHHVIPQPWPVLAPGK